MRLATSPIPPRSLTISPLETPPLQFTNLFSRRLADFNDITPLIFTAYLPAKRLAVERREWSSLLQRAGFELQVWSDRTEAWREFMRAKHARRLAQAARILTEHGAAALPELLVSRAMLGSTGNVPYLSQRNRIWIKAQRR